MEEEVRVLRNETAAKDYTGIINQTQRRLEGVEARLEGIDQEKKDLEQDVKDLDSQYQQAQQQLQASQSAQEEKKRAYDKAAAEWEAAEEQAKKDEAAVQDSMEEKSQATKQFSKARQDLGRGKSLLPRLQNSLTNLKTWKDRGTQAQGECTKQHEACKTANDELQKLPDEPITEVNTKFEQVKKTSKETTYQEKQVRQTQQYMEAGRSQIEEVQALLPAQTEAGESQTGGAGGT